MTATMLDNISIDNLETFRGGLKVKKILKFTRQTIIIVIKILKFTRQTIIIVINSVFIYIYMFNHQH